MREVLELCIGSGAQVARGGSLRGGSAASSPGTQLAQQALMNNRNRRNPTTKPLDLKRETVRKLDALDAAELEKVAGGRGVTGRGTTAR
jgi:hypothetical protein